MRILQKSINTFAIYFFIFFVLLADFSAFAKTIDRVVGKVNDSIITLSEVEERALALQAKLQDTPQALTKEESLREALSSLIDEKLLLDEGKKKDIKVDEAQVDKAVKGIQKQNNLSDETLKLMLEREGISFEKYKEQIRNQILISRVRKVLFENRLRIGEKKLKQYYKIHRKVFTTRSKIHARHIMFILDEDLSESAKQLKREKARKVLREIRSGANFIEMAKIHSEDASATKGGDLGILEEGKMIKGFQDASFKLSAGEVSPIIETPYGLHIIKVDKKIPRKILSYKEAKNQIREIVKYQGLQKKYEQWIDELEKTAYIEESLFKDRKKKSRRPKKGTRQTARLSKKKNHYSLKKPPLKPKSNKKSKASLKKPIFKKSVERNTKHKGANKNKNSTPSNLELSTIEKKFFYIKKLKNEKKISEPEYKKRKKKLLKQL